MTTPQIPDEIVELAARARKPYLWNGHLRGALAKSSSFTDAQAEEQVVRKQKEIREEVRAILEAAAPGLMGWDDGEFAGENFGLAKPTNPYLSTEKEV